MRRAGTANETVSSEEVGKKVETSKMIIVEHGTDETDDS